MYGENAKRRYAIIFVILCLIFTASYISLIFNQNVWTDEAYTIELIRENTLRGIISSTANDVHPPLYYLMLKLFIIILGDSIPVYKFFSVVPMLLCFVLDATLIRRYWGEKTAVLFIFLINGVPCLLEYIIQIRMYSWAMLWVMWAGISAYGVYREQKISNQIQLIIASVCACYTHNYAMLSCVCIFITLAAVMLKKTKQWLVAGAIVSALYIPWLLVLYQQTVNRIGNYWIDDFSVRDIPGYIEFWFGSDIPYSAWMLGILSILGIVQCVMDILAGKEHGKEALCMLGIPVFTTAIGIIVSVLITPFFIARYIIPCIGLWALFAAVSFGKCNRRFQIALAIFMILMYIGAYKTNYQTEYESAKTDELLEFMNENLEDNDCIVYNYEIYGFIYEIYFDSEQLVYLENMDFSQDYDNIWFFDSCVTPWLDNQTLADNGLEKEFIGRMGIEQNEFSLYKISRQ